MEAQIERPEERKDVHQDEQDHRRHDECHLQLVIAHPTRGLVRGGGLHISYGKSFSSWLWETISLQALCCDIWICCGTSRNIRYHSESTDG